MRFVLPVFAKLNLTLRVTGRRDDGYHDLVSLMTRVPSGDVLYVGYREPDCSNDVVRVSGIELPLSEENTVAKALRLARAAGFSGPMFDVEIAKSLLPGSGMGGGSGDAATMLRWLATTSERNSRLPWADIARQVGADVPYLFAGYPAAVVSGIGEKIEPVKKWESLSGFAVFPNWSVGTQNAYSSLDSALKARGRDYVSDNKARQELAEIYNALSRQERVGLLPNDFCLHLRDEHPQYDKLFDIFEAMGCLAWGITGSGSAAFAIHCGLANFRIMGSVWPEWVKQVLVLGHSFRRSQGVN